MSEMKDTLILAVESSCDETAAAVVRNGREILSNIIYSQIDLHTLYGGVVPEIASRKHIEKINQVIEKALAEAGVTLAEIDAVGVTYGPGLVGALLVGVAEAKAIAYAAGKPLVGVHHIEGHIAANYIEHPDLEPPFLCLVVSGGHTHLVRVRDYGTFDILGRTRDDAAGEAFDKVARAIGLGYPGGPKIDRVAREGDPQRFHFAKPHVPGYDYSFSGVKTSLLYFVRDRMASEPDFVPVRAPSMPAAVPATLAALLFFLKICASAVCGAASARPSAIARAVIHVFIVVGVFDRLVKKVVSRTKVGINGGLCITEIRDFQPGKVCNGK